MSQEPVEVEVLDKDEMPVLVEKRHSLLNPLNFLMFILAGIAAFGILLVAIGTVIEQRARERNGEDDAPDPD